MMDIITNYRLLKNFLEVTHSLERFWRKKYFLKLYLSQISRGRKNERRWKKDTIYGLKLFFKV